MDWFQITVNIIQIISSIWVVLFGGKATIDIVKHIFKSRQTGQSISIKAIKGTTITNILLALILLILVSLIAPFIHLPVSSDRNIPSTPPPSSAGLTPQEVQTWCSPLTKQSDCDLNRFEQSPVAAGGVDPNKVHMKTGAPVKIKLPQGFSAQVWDCSKYSDAKGPAELQPVCDMQVKRL